MSKNQTSNAFYYKQLQNLILEMIEENELPPGEKIPSERELSEMLGFSRMTVRHGVDELVQLGILERNSTVGTFVRSTKIKRQIGRSSKMGLSQLLKESGVEPGSRLISFEKTRSHHSIAIKLNIRAGEKIVVITRLRLADGLPFCIEKTHIPQSYVPGLSQTDFIENISLYELLKNRYQINIIGAEQRLSLLNITDEEAEYLDILPGRPCILLQTIAFDANNRPIEFVKGINHPDRVVFKTFGGLKYDV